jgi:hypothetical protein
MFMRITLASLLAIAAIALCGGGTASAAPAGLGKAVNATSLATKAKCRVVRRCTYWGCSSGEICD